MVRWQRLVLWGLCATSAGCELLTRPGEVQFVTADGDAMSGLDAADANREAGDESVFDAMVDGGMESGVDVAMDARHDVIAIGEAGSDAGDAADTALDDVADESAPDVAEEVAEDAANEAEVDASDDAQDDVSSDDAQDDVSMDDALDVSFDVSVNDVATVDVVEAGTMDVCNAVCDGGCVDTQSDPNNCSVCGYSCLGRPSVAVASCVAGACSFRCDPGRGDCDMSRDNGCETNTTNDANHCGNCSTVCPSAPNATATCQGSRCTFTCMPGWEDCNGLPDDGCETSLTASPNCGACGRVCGTAGDSCIATGSGTYDCCATTNNLGCGLITCAPLFSCRNLNSKQYCCHL